MTSGLFLARRNEAARSLFLFFIFIFLLFDLKRCVKNAGWCCIPFIEWKPGAAALSSMIENDGAISNGLRYTAVCLSVGYSSRTLCDRHMSVQCVDSLTGKHTSMSSCNSARRPKPLGQPLHPISSFSFESIVQQLVSAILFFISSGLSRRKRRAGLCI